MTRRKFLKLILGASAGLACASTSGYVYASRIETKWLEVNTLSLTLPRLAPAFNGYKLVQISDIHLGTGMTRDHLNYVVELINQQQPDSVAITGDFVTHGDIDPLMTPLAETLSALSARDAVVAVLGNHDHWTNPAQVRGALAAAGVLDVSNSVYSIWRGDHRLHLAGIDSYWERLDRLDDVTAALPVDGAAVLLAHEPDFADISAATGRFDLQVSGHSHGGQVIMPFVGPLIVPRLSRKYPIGLYQVNSMTQYTNRGIGTILPAVRFNCRPEITVFSLFAP